MVLAALQKLPSDRSPWSQSELDGLISQIGQLHGTKIAAPAPTCDAPGNEQAPSGLDLASARRTLARGERAEGFGEAFEILTRHDPGPVVRFLVAWMNPNQDWHDRDRDMRWARTSPGGAVRIGRSTWPLFQGPKTPSSASPVQSTCALMTPRRELPRSSG